jgi:hypothetical protein
MNRRICSYDRVAVPEPSFVLKDGGGDLRVLPYALGQFLVGSRFVFIETAHVWLV